MVKTPPANAGNTGSIPGSESSYAVGNCNLLQYSCMKNPMDRGAWRATAHRVTKSRTRLNTGYIVKVTPYSYFYFSFTCSVSAHPASSHPSALTAFCVIYLDVCLVKNILLTGLVFLFVLLYFFNL